MNRFKIILLNFSVLFFVGCAGIGEISPQNLENTKSQSVVTKLENNATMSFDEFANELKNIDILLVGELHKNKNHKAWEILLIKELAKSQKIDIAMEMISSDKQALIDKAYQNKILADDMPNAIKWDKKWPLSHYGEIAKTAYKLGKLKGGNLSQSEINTIFAGAQPIKGEVSTTKKVKTAIRKGIELSHGKLDDYSANLFVEAQQYKDRRMADVLNKAQNKAMLIAGNFHTFKNIGVPLHLIDFKTNKKVKVLIMSDKDLGNLGIESADYILKLK